MTEQEQLSEQHIPKHVLETSLLGKVKNGMQRVSDIAAQRDDSAATESQAEPSSTFEHGE